MSGFRFAKPSRPKAVVMALGYGVVVLIGLLGVWAMNATQARQAEMVDMNAVIARAAAVSQDGAMTGGLSDDAFHVGDTPQLAQAILQTNLQELADVHSIAVDVIRTDQIEQIDGYVRLNLTVNGTAPETELPTFLHGLASLEPIVFIEEISLRRARATRSNAIRRISFQLQLYGLAQR